jgi:hypothetical protein
VDYSNPDDPKFYGFHKKMSDPEPDQVPKLPNMDSDPTKQKSFRFGSTKLMDSQCCGTVTIYYGSGSGSDF